MMKHIIINNINLKTENKILNNISVTVYSFLIDWLCCLKESLLWSHPFVEVHLMGCC